MSAFDGAMESADMTITFRVLYDPPYFVASLVN
jgi:hypothetical protein